MKTLKLLSGALLMSTFITGNALAGEPSPKSIMLKPTSTKAEGEGNAKNVIKLNLFSLGIKDFSFQYERAFHKNMSAALGIGFLPGRGLPSSVTSADPTGTLKTLKFSGFAITPEFRYYPGKKVEKQAPRGFYLAPYLRYSSYTASTGFLFEQEMSNPTTGVMETKPYTLDLSVKYSGFGGGLMMGIQWLIKDRVSIDWWLVGAHGGGGSANLDVSGSALSTILNDPTVVPVVDASGNPTGATTTIGEMTKEQLETQLEKIKSPRGTTHAEVTSSAVTFGVDGVGYLGLRTGLTIGFAF